MATYVNVTVGGDDLLNRDRQLRQATRFDALDRQKDKEVEKEKEKQEQEPQGKSLKPLPYKREPAAHRFLTGMAAAQVETRTEGNDLVIKVSTPSGNAKVEVRHADAVISEALPALPANIDIAVDDHPTSGYLIDFSEYITADSIRHKKTYAYANKSFSDNRDRIYVLPAGGDKCIVVYRLNRLNVRHAWALVDEYKRTWKVEGSLTYYEHTYTDNTVVPPRDYTTTTWWYPFTGASFPDTVVGLKNFRAGATRYNKISESWVDSGTYFEKLAEPIERINAAVYCFSVSKNRVKRISPPAAVTAWLNTHHPPLALNWNNYLVGGNFFDKRHSVSTPNPYGPNGGPPFLDRPELRATAYDWDSQVTPDRSGFFITGYTPNNYSSDIDKLTNAKKALPFHFGFGNINTTSHYSGSYFTPAIFETLAGNVSLSDTKLNEYAHMRSTHYAAAPQQYIGKCLQAGSCTTSQRTEFFGTRQTPVNTTTIVPGPYSPLRSYDVEHTSPNAMYYAWDWGRPSLCQGACIALGFSAADLRP